MLRLALPVLAKIHVTHAAAGDHGLIETCEGVIKPGSKGLVYVDEPTTKAEIVLADMELAFKTACKATGGEEFVSIAVCCGRRFELVGLVMSKMKMLCPERDVYVVTLAAGAAQSKLKKATCFILLAFMYYWLILEFNNILNVILPVIC